MRIEGRQAMGSRCGLAGGLAAIALALAAGQGATADYRAPRTAAGAPDLQGLWTNSSLTKLERPAGIMALILTDAEASAAERALLDKQDHPTGSEATVGGHETEWWDGAGLARMSISGHFLDL